MGLKVLSLFDGMSCGQIALRELGIAVDEYYASEIDKFCIEQTKLNFPNTIQLGDVRNINVSRIPKIDLILAGSPCQGFSFAGKRLNFDDPRSALFFEFHRILSEVYSVNPNVKFLLENVKMVRKHEEIINAKLGGLHPTKINSALVSAQNRVRLYWSNIRSIPIGLFGEYDTNIPQPVDRGLYLADILEDEVDERYYITDTVLRSLLTHKERNEKNGRGYGMVVKFPKDKSFAVRVGGKGMYDIVCAAMRGRHNEERSGYFQQLEVRKDKKSNTLTTAQKDNLILQRPRGRKGITAYAGKSPTLTSNSWEHNNILHRRVVQLNTTKESNGKQPYQQHRIYSAAGISPSLFSSCLGQSPLIIEPGYILRRMTPTECARLQTIPEWYKWGCSATQQYKMLGNGWTVEVIKHILSFLEI